MRKPGYGAIEERNRKARERKVWEGIQKAEQLHRLRHQKWCAASPFPRKFGFVEAWDDKKGEGIVSSQEDHNERYLVIRDEITRCTFNHKTLDIMEFVEFFATDEMDAVANLPLAKNVTGPMGTFTKSSEDYRIAMLRHGDFPKKWQDTPEEYAWMKRSSEPWMDKTPAYEFPDEWKWKGDDGFGDDEEAEGES